MIVIIYCRITKCIHLAIIVTATSGVAMDHSSGGRRTHFCIMRIDSIHKSEDVIALLSDAIMTQRASTTSCTEYVGAIFCLKVAVHSSHGRIY